MQRLVSLFLVALSLGALLFSQSDPVMSQAFITNTPRPTIVEFITNTPAITDVPTETATPSPTLTPSLTPTETPTNTPTSTPTETPTQTPTPTPTPVGPFSYPDGINSLTGLAYPDETAQNRRNLMVKISNYPAVVRPQSGLNQADVIWEYEVEGGVTRFAAIFRTNAPDHVGPVRSGRLVDLELAPMYNALWAYSGSSAPIMQIALDGEQTPWGYNIFSPQFGDNCEDAGFCRFPKEGLALEHTLYLDTNVLWAKADRRGVNLPERARGFAFSEDLLPSDLVANDIHVNWFGQIDARWQYDPATARYLRFTDGVPHFDAAEDAQVWVDNLVIIQAPHNQRPDLFELESNSASIEIAMWNEDGGYYPAVLARDGVYYQGFWERRDKNMGSALQLKFANGEPMKLKPGRTWVMIVRWLAQDVALVEAYADMDGTAAAIMATQGAVATATAESAG